MKARSKNRMTFLILILLTGCAGVNSPTDAPLTQVTLQLSWTHQAQFGGFYAADQNGYYADEGLAVTFIEGGPGLTALEPVVNGSAQFGVLNADLVLVARSTGQPVQALAAVYRRSPRVYVALAGSGITRPQDFVGKTIALNRGGHPLLIAMMQKLGISEDQYVMVDSRADLVQFTSGEVDVRSVFLTNEVLTLQKDGYDLNIIYPDDYGIHNYADTIITTDETIASNRDLVLRFLRATLKGWTWAVENPDEAGALTLRYKPDADPDTEVAKMTASIPLINTGEDFIGWMKPEIWIGMEATLREQGVLTAPEDVARVYTMQFLEEIYK